jgi:hypothetical protein
MRQKPVTNYLDREWFSRKGTVILASIIRIFLSENKTKIQFKLITMRKRI